ncbi:MAG: hypothetical protein EHM12_01680 [Dehalococcoidia bacterium]|nr:MAG: hypothetical protein EHM12_01680 [Dehalococcoidia bacterium]
MQNTKYYEKPHYRFLSNNVTIHAFVLLGLLAILGYAATSNAYLLICAALSFAGAMCGAFMRIKIAIEKKS